MKFTISANKRTQLSTTELPEYLSVLIDDIREVEPQIGFGTTGRLQADWPLAMFYSESAISAAMKILFEKISSPPDTLIVLPWLSSGGSELVARHMISALDKANEHQRILVLVTDEVGNLDKNFMISGIQYISTRSAFPAIDVNDCASIITRLVHGFGIKRVLNFNSLACWEAYRISGPMLSRISLLYASLFCYDYDENNNRTGYAVKYFRDSIPFLAAVFVDNQRFIDELIKEYALPDAYRKKLVLLRQPFLEAPRKEHYSIIERPSVLWASRISRQKNFTILRDIAEQRPSFDFHIYGRGSAAELQQFNTMISELSNVHYHGEYRAFLDIKPHNFDVFLYTSLWDGLPNVLLEAASSGLPIVAPDVGGISELIDNATGFLVNDPSSADAYLAQLDAAIIATQSKDRVDALYSRLIRLHSTTAYRETLSSFPNPEHAVLKC